MHKYLSIRYSCIMEVLIFHQIGSFDASAYELADMILSNCLKVGLKSKNQLIKEGMRKELPVKGIFSDEHENIYFWPTIGFIDRNSPFIAIKVNSDEVYVYNSRLRGKVDYFAYEASKMTLSQYLERHENNMQIRHDISGLDSVLTLLKHRITAKPLFIQAADKYLDQLDQYYQEYSPEVVIPANIIPNNYLALYGKRNKKSNDFEAVFNENAEMFSAHEPEKRGIFLNDEGNKYYIPTNSHIEDDFGKIFLHSGYNPYWTERYVCSAFHQQINIAKLLSSNIKIEPDPFDTENGRLTYIIKGDDRDNIIKLLPNTANIVIGKGGADIIYVAESDWLTTIIDFNSSEDDKLGFPKELYSSVDEIISKIIYKDEIAIISTNDFGSLLLANIFENALSAEDFFIY